jgi:hypothetical protein
LQQTFLNTLVARLCTVPGIAAIVLGGSRARGTATPTSDYDLGLYYRPERPPDLAALAQVAAALDDNPRPDLITPLGGWGPWINGGGWLRVQGQPVDLLYRDLGRVAQVVEDCCAGRVEIFYQVGHPHGFVNAIYLAEVATCRVLWDPDDLLEPLKARARPYPPRLKQETIAKFRWETGFALETAVKAAQRGDTAYVAGCCFRATACLMQVIFALNEEYLLNEKGAVALAATFAHSPANLVQRIDAAYAQLAAPATLPAALATLTALADEVQEQVSAALSPNPS